MATRATQAFVEKSTTLFRQMSASRQDWTDPPAGQVDVLDEATAGALKRV